MNTSLMHLFDLLQGIYSFTRCASVVPYSLTVWEAHSRLQSICLVDHIGSSEEIRKLLDWRKRLRQPVLHLSSYKFNFILLCFRF